MLKLSRAEWALLIWSALLLLGAVVAKQFHFSETTSSSIGAIEVFLTVLTGVALGLTASYKRPTTPKDGVVARARNSARWKRAFPGGISGEGR